MIYVHRAIQDIKRNRFLHAVTIITITLSILIVSVFGLFWINVNSLMDTWKQGIRIIVYLRDNTSENEAKAAKNRIMEINGIQEVVFIPKNDALNRLKKQMSRQASLFENLRENPLPDAFDVRLELSAQEWKTIETIASKLSSLPSVASVEYGQKWLGRFMSIFNLFRLTGLAMCCVFFMASVFIVANTIRLLFYSRHEEFDIMRLVGATDSFIKTPFYIIGLIQGAIGGGVGVLILYILYTAIVSNVEQGFASYNFSIRFLSFKASMLIILCSMSAGWLGCYLSFKQYLDK